MSGRRHILLRVIAILTITINVLAAMPTPATANGDTIVTFPDANLEAAIREALSKPVGDIHASELATLTSLNAEDKGIINLSGLEYCTNLTSLYLGSNQISDLTPLAGLTSLTYLWLYNNQISNLTPLAGLTRLTDLLLQNNQISNLTPLSGLTSLTTLWLHNNQISDITPLAGLTSLNSLLLFENQISNITPLTGLTSLTNLQLSHNQISDITPLAGLTRLTDLLLDNNQISNLTPLSGLTSLTTLGLHNNQISDITPLTGLTNLSVLILYTNQISDITPLTGLTSLQALRLGGNQVSDLTPLTGLTMLQFLYLEYNQISDLTPLTGLTSLTDLQLSHNQISDLTPLTGLTMLQFLHLEYNQISDLTPLTGLTSLTDLQLSHNQISDITPLAGLTRLTDLLLQNNQISDITPLSGLTSVTFLGLNINQISDITPLSGLTSLNFLALSTNQISDLSPLAGLTSLTQLALGYNQISDLAPLAGLISLTHLFLNGNQIRDITPLVNNTGLATGDTVYLQSNALSFTSINVHIPALQARGVTVLWDTVVPSWRAGIKVGDILYANASTESELVTAAKMVLPRLRDLAHQYFPNSAWNAIVYLSHTALYIGDNKVIGAISNGVKITDIWTWDAPYKKQVKLLRVRTSNTIQIAAVEFAKEQEDKLYNYLAYLLFTKNYLRISPWWYCSELCWASYYNEGKGINIEYNETNSNQPQGRLLLDYNDPVFPNEILNDADVYEVGNHIEGTWLESGQWVIVLSPIDIILKTPDGHTIRKGYSGLTGASYKEGDFDNDGNLEDIIYVPTQQTGNYHIYVIPDPDAKPTDTYSLVFANSQTGSGIVLAAETKISDIPKEGYTVNWNGKKAQVVVTPPQKTGITDTQSGGISTKPPSSSATVTSDPQQLPVQLANIQVKSASLSASKVSTGTPVVVTASVTNRGTANGSSLIKLYVNGEEEASQGITLKSGDAQSIYFTISRNQPGTYTVYVNNTQAGSFVIEDVIDPNIILIISCMLIFLSFLLGTIYIYRRRKYGY